MPLNVKSAIPDRTLFAGTIAFGSFLLFIMQPMVARMALPALGGSPAVWNSAMVVYQALLLAGYAYAHRLSSMRIGTQRAVHGVAFLAAAAWLPLGLTGNAADAAANPVTAVPLLLAASIGPLFLLVAAQAPLIQRWHAADPARGDPYPLYAASNIGSFTGLLGYPLLVEPFMGLDDQRKAWTAGFLLLASATAFCAARLETGPARDAAHDGPAKSAATSGGTILRWMLLAAVPSGLMLSTNTTLTTDVAATPMLWVLPLAVYLLSFVAAFSDKAKLAVAAVRMAPVLMLISGGTAFMLGGGVPAVTITVGLFTLYAVSLALHGELHRTRPAPDRLTGFYLAMSAGGVVGGLFCAIIAPILFNWTYEHAILIVAAALIIPVHPLMDLRLDPRTVRRLRIGLPTAAAVATAVGLAGGAGTAYVALMATALAGLIIVNAVGGRRPFIVILLCLMLLQGGWAAIDAGEREVRFRSYFGSYRLIEERGIRALLHGTTTHGMQVISPVRSNVPTSYYGSTSGVGRLLGMRPTFFGDAARVGVVGLGAGMLACYRTGQQDWTFYEIDPDVVRMAKDPAVFSYMTDCAPDAAVITGDARISLKTAPEAGFDVLVLDAFISDSIPIHLLTREAFRIYGRALTQDGIVMVHVSNRHLDLEPVLAALTDRGWSMRTLYDMPPAKSTDQQSVWVAMSRDPEAISRLNAAGGGWRPTHSKPGYDGWTDDHSSILPLLHGF